MPDDWNLATVVPILKSGGRIVLATYRPISLTSIVCKLMEHLITKLTSVVCKLMEHLITKMGTKRMATFRDSMVLGMVFLARVR